MHVNVNGVWRNASNHVNVNGSWRNAIQYANVNGVWRSDRAPFPKLSFTSILHNSMYGENNITSTFIEITSGYYSYGTCAVRSNQTVNILKGDVIKCSSYHTRTAVGSGTGQRGRIYLSQSGSYSSSTANTITLYNSTTEGRQDWTTHTRQATSTVNMSNAYVWVVLEGYSGADTHMSFSGFTINDQRIY